MPKNWYWPYATIKIGLIILTITILSWAHLFLNIGNWIYLRLKRKNIREKKYKIEITNPSDVKLP